MRRIWVMLAVVAGAVVWAPTPAHAKGLVEVTVRIETPGPARAVRIESGELASNFALATRFYPGLEGAPYGTGPIAEPTDERLGPRYVATFRAHEGRDEVVQIRQDLYPFADLGPLVFTPPDQGWDDSGWRRVGWSLVDLLGELGVHPPGGSRWRTVLSEAGDFALTIPSSWRRATSSRVTRGVGPILVVGSSAVTTKKSGDGCLGAATRALASVGPTDALVVVLRYQPPAVWTADTFVPDLWGAELPWQPWPAECPQPRETATVRTLRVPLHGARLQVVVAVGGDATATASVDVYRVLDSLRAGPRWERVSRLPRR